MRPIVWLAAAATAAALAAVIFLSGDRREPPPRVPGPPPAAAADPTRPAPANPVEAPVRTARDPGPAGNEAPGEAEDPADLARRVQQERLARDPVRIQTATRTFEGFEDLFLDPTGIEAVGPGDIVGRIEPEPLAKRRRALFAIDALIAQPENQGAIQGQAVRVLDTILRQPWPAVSTPEAERWVLEERGHALATLVEADPAAAAQAYRDIPGSELRARIGAEAVERWVQEGLAREDAEARIAGLSDR